MASNFEGMEFREYCLGIGVKKCEVFANNPRANGAMERMNGNVFSAVKKKSLVGIPKGKWAEMLPTSALLPQDLRVLPPSGCYMVPK